MRKCLKLKKYLFISYLLSNSLVWAATSDSVRIGKQNNFKLRKKIINEEAPLIYSTDPGANRFKSVGKLRAYSDCTATLIAGSGAPKDDAPALILTAGHCVTDNFGVNEVIVDQPVTSGWEYIPNYFIDTQTLTTPIAINRVVYATMKYVDLAVLQLNTTYKELAQQGILPLKLKPGLTPSGQAIELAHIPIIGIDWDQRYLRHSSCHIRGMPSIVYEYTLPWIWRPAFSVDCIGVVGGTSGGPLVNSGESAMIGILNTTVTSGMTGCGLGRPCEVIDNKGYPRESMSYFIPVDKIAYALTESGQLDVNKLDDGKGSILDNGGDWTTQSTVDGKPAQWNINVKGVTNIRYKFGLANDTDCTNPQGYGATLPGANQPLYNLLTPAQDGIYAMCVIGQHEDGSWQPVEYASVMLREINDLPLTLKPDIVVNDCGDVWSVEPIFNPYTITMIQAKYGPLNSTDCNPNTGGYLPYRKIPVYLSKESGPWRFCAYGQDPSFNSGPVSMQDLDTSGKRK